MKAMTWRRCALLAGMVAGLIWSGGAGAATSAAQSVTAATFNDCRLRLWYGSLRLNRDEWPLVVRDRYTFQSGGQAVEPRFGWWYNGVQTSLGTNWFEIRTDDPAGKLVRRVTFGANSLELRFNLHVRPEYRKNPEVRYQVQFSPEYFYGRDDTQGAQLRVTRAAGQVERIFLPPFSSIRADRSWRKFFDGWRAAEMHWSGLAGPQRMGLEIIEGEEGVFVDDRVSRYVYDVSIIPVLTPATNDAAEVRCAVRIVFPAGGGLADQLNIGPP